MYAQLGNHLFENLKSFQSYNKTGAAVYAEHALIEGKPRLQKTGLSLDEITLSMRFHASFCVPADELAALKTSRDDGEVLTLLWGNGKIEGTFVITELSETIEEADPQGNIFSYLVNCTLREFVVKDKLQQKQADNRKNASATGTKKPVALKKKNPSTCPQTITNLVSKIDNHARTISKIVLEQGGGGDVVNRNKILHHLSAIRLLVEDLLRRCDDANSCAHEDPNVKYRAQQVYSAQNNFNQVAANSQTAQYPAQNQILAACVRNLKAAIQKLSNQVLTRK